MKKVTGKIMLISLLISLSVSFAGCNFLNFSAVTDLLKAPKLTGENAELQKAFERAVGDDVSLLSPLTGNYKSAYILYDCNGDNSEEAIVFYCADSTDRIVHMNILKKQNGRWISAADVIGSGSEVYNVEFLNIDNDSNTEMLVTWTVSDTKKEKTLSVYKMFFDTNYNISVTSLAAVSVFDHIFLDADEDGATELFYLYYDSSEDKNGAYLRMLKYNDELTALVPISEIKLNPLISTVLSLKYDVTDQFIEFFIDCMINENTYYTELIIYEKDNKSLTDLFLLNNEDAVNITKRSVSSLCADINNDGLIEIPVELSSEESYIINNNTADTVPLTLTDWQRYNNNSMVSIKRYFDNSLYDFKICVNDLREFAYIVYNAATGEIQFKEKTAEHNNTVLFSIKPIKETESSLYNKNNYKIIITDRGKQMNITSSFVESIIE